MRRITSSGALILALSTCWPAIAGDSPLQAYMKQLKGRQFVLRAHQDLFGPSRYAKWDFRRIYEADVVADAGSVRIGNNSDGQGKYFIPAQPYSVKDVTFKNDRAQAQIKLWAAKPDTGYRTKENEICVNFPNVNSLTVESFKSIFFTIVFAPGEDVDGYVRANDAKLIAAYLDPFPEIFMLPDADRRKILRATRLISLSPKPQLEKVGSDVYIPADLIGDTSVYNDIRVSKNQRIASSIESLLPRMKIAVIGLDGLPSVIHGIRFYWTVMHRDFLNQTEYEHTSEHIDLLVSADAMKKVAAGNLSVLEMLQQSILRADGTKITLSSYEPIGQH